METSILIAKLFGVAYVGMALGILCSNEYYRKLFADFTKNTPFIFMWGMMAVVVGTAILSVHNIWEYSWVVIITIIGWAGLIKGLFLLIFPKTAGYFSAWFNNKAFMAVLGIGALIFGLVLCYFGFLT